MKPMQNVVSLMLLLALSFASPELRAQSPFDSLHEEANRLIRQSFAKGKLALDPSSGRDTYSFSTGMREFMVYTPDKIGNWQGPNKYSAPDRGGFSVSYHIHEGPWQGALSVPRVGTDDHYLFKQTFVIKESEDKKYHIWAMIVTPKFEADDKLRDALVKLFSEFDSHRKVRALQTTHSSPSPIVPKPGVR